MFQDSYENINPYVQSSTPFMPFPSYNDLQNITLRDWFDINMNKPQANGIVIKSDDIIDTQVQAQRAPEFLNLMKQNMTNSQCFDVKSQMMNTFEKCITKPGGYRLRDLYSCFLGMIEKGSHMHAVGNMYSGNKNMFLGLSMQGFLQSAIEKIDKSLGKQCRSIVDNRVAYIAK